MVSSCLPKTTNRRRAPQSHDPASASPLPAARYFVYSALLAVAFATAEQLPQHHLEQRVLLDNGLLGDFACAGAGAGQSGDGGEGLSDGAVAESSCEVGEVDVAGFEGLWAVEGMVLERVIQAWRGREVKGSRRA
jgi:hypothetical protein